MQNTLLTSQKRKLQEFLKLKSLDNLKPMSEIHLN
jgi:hypothetical protein